MQATKPRRLSVHAFGLRMGDGEGERPQENETETFSGLEDRLCPRP
jgi:hypothetical protein